MKKKFTRLLLASSLLRRSYPELASKIKEKRDKEREGGGDRRIQQLTMVAILRVFNGDQDFPRIRPSRRKQLDGGRTLDQNTESTLVTLKWYLHP